MRTSLPLSFVAALVLFGCTQDFEQYRPGEGAGGNPAGGAPAGGAGGLGGSGATGAGATGAGGSGGGPECTVPGDCLGADACNDPTCTAGTCGLAPKADGTACPKDGKCMSGMCVPPTCTNLMEDGAETDVDCGGGVCLPCGEGLGCDNDSDCLTGVCDGNNICVPCNDSDQCESTSYCNTDATPDTCEDDLAVGSPCEDDSACQGNANCVDGFCCNGPCNGECESCADADSIGMNGECSLIDIAADPDPDDECSSMGCQSGACNALAAACALDPAGTSCGAATCANAMLTERECDAAGGCMDVNSACGVGYACTGNGSACETSCNDNGDCQPAFHCSGSTCVADKANGMPCAGGDDGECVSGNCVDDHGDNVCCDTPCDQRCESCDMAGSVGTCTPITSGDPDTECPDPPDNGDNCAGVNNCSN